MLGPTSFLARNPCLAPEMVNNHLAPEMFESLMGQGMSTIWGAGRERDEEKPTYSVVVSDRRNE